MLAVYSCDVLACKFYAFVYDCMDALKVAHLQHGCNNANPNAM